MSVHPLILLWMFSILLRNHVVFFFLFWICLHICIYEYVWFIFPDINCVSGSCLIAGDPLVSSYKNPVWYCYSVSEWQIKFTYNSIYGFIFFYCYYDDNDNRNHFFWRTLRIHTDIWSHKLSHNTNNKQRQSHQPPTHHLNISHIKIIIIIITVLWLSYFLLRANRWITTIGLL